MTPEEHKRKWCDEQYRATEEDAGKMTPGHVWIVEWSFPGNNVWEPIIDQPFQTEDSAKSYLKRPGLDYRIVEYRASQDEPPILLNLLRKICQNAYACLYQQNTFPGESDPCGHCANCMADAVLGVNWEKAIPEYRANTGEPGVRTFQQADCPKCHQRITVEVLGLKSGKPGRGVPKWISVDERLPDDYVTVLIAHTVVPAGALVPGGDYVWIGKIVDKQWVAADSRPGPQELHANVTHWRPLPTPPSTREGE